MHSYGTGSSFFHAMCSAMLGQVADELLRRTKDPNVDFCTVCKSKVYIVATEAEMDRIAGEGKCVTYDPDGVLRKRNKHADDEAAARNRYALPSGLLPPRPVRRGARRRPDRPIEPPSPLQHFPEKPLKKPPKSATKKG